MRRSVSAICSRRRAAATGRPPPARARGATAAGALARVYVIQPENANLQTGPTGGGNIRGSGSLVEGLDNVAGATGGTKLNLALAGETAFGRMARETSSYYVAAIESDPGDKPGSHGISLRASRTDITIRARPDVIVGRPGRRPAAGTTAPKDMVRTTAAFTDLPLRAAAFVSRNVGDSKMKVVVLFEPVEPGVSLAGTVVAMVDDKGKLVAQSTLPAVDLGRGPAIAALPVAPGSYRMRVAAVDTIGRSGAVDCPVSAALAEAGPLKMSALVLGTAQQGFVPKLVFGPHDEAAVGLVEVYGVTSPGSLSAVFELAETEDGPAITTGQAGVSPGGGPDAFQISGGFAIGALPARDVVMRVVVTVDGRQVGRVVRTLRKTD